MSKKKVNKPGHVYSDEQNKWILDNAKLQRTDLAKQFNKKFGTRLSAVAVAKRRQRMTSVAVKVNEKPVHVKKFQGGGSDSPHGKVSTREVFDLIKDNQRLIEKLIDKL